jgi:hypothetical protein
MKLDKNTILFNAGGGLAVLVVGVYFVKTTIFPSKEPPCSTTYSTMMQMPLEHSSGDLYTPAEVQARLAGRDDGVIDFSRVVRVKSGPGTVLEVDLPKGSLGPRSTVVKGGVGFQWRPNRIDGARAACLTYSVWLPFDFDFKKGGTLPGLYGASEAGRGDKTVFAARYMWREGGKAEILATLPVNGEARTSSSDADAFRLQAGRWTKIEQEIVLNTPGMKDGALRVWVDGQQVVEKKGIVLRDSEQVGFGGVQADVYYGGTDSSFAAPKDTKIRFTPFELRLP